LPCAAAVYEMVASHTQRSMRCAPRLEGAAREGGVGGRKERRERARARERESACRVPHRLQRHFQRRHLHVGSHVRAQLLLHQRVDVPDSGVQVEGQQHRPAAAPPSLRGQQQVHSSRRVCAGAQGRGVRPYTLSEITVGQQRGVSRIRLRCSETVDKVRPPRAHGLRMLRYVYWWRRRGREGSGGGVDKGHTHEPLSSLSGSESLAPKAERPCARAWALAL
jgi:hypothetical protein